MSTKRERHLECLIGFIRRRTPGRGSINLLYQTAFDYDDTDPGTARRLRCVADRLSEIRTAIRGPGRTEIDLDRTHRLIRDNDGSPFG